MYTRLLSFMNTHTLFYDSQFGFWPLHSPNLALILLVDNILGALERGEYVLGLFLYFSQAFDTVNHKILFQKLEFYGVRGTALKWFQSYLTDRTQYVEYNDFASSNGKIVRGVPQGSILGPLSLILFINNLSNAPNIIFSILFADDYTMLLTVKDPNMSIRTMNQEMQRVVDWLKLNKLSLYLKKTHFVLFRRKQDKLRLSEDLIV